MRDIIRLIRSNYNLDIKNIELFRESVNTNCTYAVDCADKKYFFKAVNNLASLEMQTAIASVDIQLYLLESGVPAAPIIFTRDGEACVRIDNNNGEKYMYIMYEFIDGSTPRSIIKAGETLGRVHSVMQNYHGQMIERGRYYFIDRYVNLMRENKYARVDFFSEYGEELWDKIKNLPRGYCHCDLYDGNMIRADSAEDKIYIVDFDTSCYAFPVYDIALFCNRTNYFNFDYKGYEKTRIRLDKFLTGYQRYNKISECELARVYIMLAVYHFQLCAQQIEREGYHDDTPDNGFVSNTLIFWERQYDWLNKWRDQCMQMNSW